MNEKNPLSRTALNKARNERILAAKLKEPSLRNVELAERFGVSVYIVREVLRLHSKKKRKQGI